ncbi:MAG TPA: M48 family metallopeptidase [Woeseiaceae bacterium]|nr:M48 family metallopeptidase [Woeseiaceae bacterium]
MKYVARTPRDDVNVSQENPLIEAGTLIIGLGVICVLVVISLVLLVDVVLYFVPAKKEVDLFNAWIPADLVTVAADDPRLEKLDALLQDLASYWPDTDYQFRVEVNDSAEINALAFPGGLIVVTSGLLDALESENELSLVLGHELGHFKNRDHIRALGRGAALSILFAALGSSNTAASLSSSVASMTLNGFSRRQELAADAFGLSIVYARYGHVAAASGLFERLGEEGGNYGGLSSYFRTHPAPADRVSILKELASRNGWHESGEITAIAW